MWFWVMCGALAVLVAGAILSPFWRARGAAGAGPEGDGAAAFDLRVYRDQLREVDRDLERGVIGAADAERLRREIGRKVLDADRRMTTETGASAGGRAPGLAAVALLVAGLVAAAGAVYWREGARGTGDLPLKARFAAAERVYAGRPSQAEAEARAPAVAPVEADPEFVALIERLREAVARNPNDPQGLSLLAVNEARLGNLAAARAAQDKLIAIRGDAVSADELTQLAALMIEQAGGLITPESEAVISRALKMDPRQPQARYMAGLLQAQNGRPDRTFPIWAELLEEGPANAPWIPPIEATIGDLAWLAGQPDWQPAGRGMPALPGPDAGAVAAAGDMTPEERQQMIAGMVQKLEDRLTTEGGNAEEWARLVSSLNVLGERDRAAAAADKARAALKDDAEGLALVEEAAAGKAMAPMAGGPMAGGAAAGGPMAPGPSAADVAAAGEMSPEERQQMIAGMVQRLETRLANEGGTPEEWARLISSLVVTGQTDHAREIWGEAQTRFGATPEALAPILDAARAAGLAE